MTRAIATCTGVGEDEDAAVLEVGMATKIVQNQKLQSLSSGLSLSWARNPKKLGTQLK